MVTEVQKRRANLDLKEKGDALKVAEILEKQEIRIKVKVGESDKLFGSVTTADIADAIKANNLEIDKRKIKLEQPLKELGVYTIPVKLHTEVEAKLKVWIEKE